jgi:hypothetical protein
LDRTEDENYTDFVGTITYTNPPAWLTLPDSDEVTRKVSVVAKDDVSDLIIFIDGGATYIGAELIFESAELDESVVAGENPTWTYIYEELTGTLGDDDKPLTAGTYKVTVMYEDSKNLGTATATFTINRAPLTLTADNKEIEIGQPQPTYTFTLAGLVGKDTNALIMNILTTQPNFELDKPFDSTKPGTFTITPSGSVATNYNISYATGTLEVICVDHDFSVRDTTTHATCTAAGAGHFLCSICGAQGEGFAVAQLDCCEHCGEEGCDGSCQTTGIEHLVETGRAPSIRVYPNPVIDELRITIDDLRIGEMIELFDMTGKCVFSQRIIRQSSIVNRQFVIDMTPFQPGHYILRIGTHVARIVKQ